MFDDQTAMMRSQKDSKCFLEEILIQIFHFYKEKFVNSTHPLY